MPDFTTADGFEEGAEEELLAVFLDATLAEFFWACLYRDKLKNKLNITLRLPSLTSEKKNVLNEFWKYTWKTIRNEMIRWNEWNENDMKNTVWEMHATSKGI